MDIEKFKETSPIPNKTLNEDGSITTFSGEELTGANSAGAELFRTMKPIPNKAVSEDGTISPLSEVIGGGGGSGQPGKAATIHVGATETAEAGQSAKVKNTGTTSAAVLEFSIPRGFDGLEGKAGKDGKDGKDGAAGVSGLNYTGGIDILRTYKKNDVVEYMGNAFIAIQDNFSEKYPPATWDSNAYWARFVAKGADGKDGRDGTDGRDGNPGLDGRDGADGRDGTDGKDGKDAVEDIGKIRDILDKIYQLQNGVVWTSGTSAANNLWRDVCYGDGIFAAVSSNGTNNRIMTSKDGKTWTTRNPGASMWHDICYGDGKFVIVNRVNSFDFPTNNSIAYSVDGCLTWKGANTLDFTGHVFNELSVCYGNGKFVAVGWDGIVRVSNNAVNWTEHSCPNRNWTDVCYGNGLFVAVADDGNTDKIMTSPDGINWTQRMAPSENLLYSVCYGNGVFAAVGRYCVHISENGINWTTKPCPQQDWLSVCYGNGVFAAVSSYGNDRIMTSADNGESWTLRKAPAANMWTGVCYGNGLFVAVAESGTNNRVMTSGRLQDNSRIEALENTVGTLNQQLANVLNGGGTA